MAQAHRPWFIITCAVALACPRALAAQTAAADSAFARGERQLARRLFEARLAADSSDTTALLRLAMLAAWDRRHDASLAFYDRLLRLAPADRDVQVARARTLAALGRFDEGFDIVDSLYRAHRDDAGVLQGRARFAAWTGDLIASEQLLRAAFERDSANTDTRVQLAQTLRWQGRAMEAYDMIRPAHLAGSRDAEVHTQHDWVAQAIRPHARSVVGYEDDSDGNAITSLVMSAGLRAARRLDVRADAYLRDAALDASAAGVTARGISTSLVLHLDPGWSLTATIGASGAGRHAGHDARPTWGIAIATPRRQRAVVAFAATRSAFDYTAPQVRNDVVADDAVLGLDLRASRDWTFAATAGWTRFDVRATDERNRRIALNVQARRRLPDPFTLVLGLRTFGFDDDVNGGYFDPDFYGLADVTLAGLREGRHWTLDGEVSTGIQRIGGGGDASAALRAWTELSYALRPGRRIGLRAAYANAGLQQLSGAGSGYTYVSMLLNVAWWF
jgi:tetratricopeptide (TPR) repeat protein